MSQGVVPQQEGSADGPKDDWQRVGALLSDALALIDALALPPEIGARLQEVIDAVAECAGAEPDAGEQDVRNRR